MTETYIDKSLQLSDFPQIILYTSTVVLKPIIVKSAFSKKRKKIINNKSETLLDFVHFGLPKIFKLIVVMLPYPSYIIHVLISMYFT